MPQVKPALRATRVAKGLKVGELASQVPGLTAKHLANCESGHGGLSIERANAIAEILGCPVDDLIEQATAQPTSASSPKGRAIGKTKPPKQAAAENGQLAEAS